MPVAGHRQVGFGDARYSQHTKEPVPVPERAGVVVDVLEVVVVVRPARNGGSEDPDELHSGQYALGAAPQEEELVEGPWEIIPRVTVDSLEQPQDDPSVLPPESDVSSRLPRRHGGELTIVMMCMFPPVYQQKIRGARTVPAPRLKTSSGWAYSAGGRLCQRVTSAKGWRRPHQRGRMALNTRGGPCECICKIPGDERQHEVSSVVASATVRNSAPCSGRACAPSSATCPRARRRVQSEEPSSSRWGTAPPTSTSRATCGGFQGQPSVKRITGRDAYFAIGSNA